MKLKIYDDEKRLVRQAIKKSKGEVVSVAKLAKSVGLNSNRTRFIIDEMLEEGTIKRTVAKAYNERYIRYTYEVVG